MNARKQLTSLQRLQELSTELRTAQAIVDSAPGRIEEIESRFRERNAEYVAVRDRRDELDRDQQTRTTAVADLEEKRKKFMDDLMQVKNQREYAAMLREIDAVKAQISDHEEAILTDMEELEKVREELKQHEDHIAQEREKVAAERAEVESDAAAARTTIDRLSAERSEVESGLPGRITDRVRQLEDTRQGIFLASVEGGTCQCCFVRLRPQAFQEVKAAAKVHICSNCRRFLYFAPTLQNAERSDGPSPDAGATESGEIGAVNGGAV